MTPKTTIPAPADRAARRQAQRRRVEIALRRAATLQQLLALHSEEGEEIDIEWASRLNDTHAAYRKQFMAPPAKGGAS